MTNIEVPEGWWQEFVSAEPARTAKLAVVRADGSPHVAPVWIGLAGNPVSEDVTMTYGPISAGANGDGGFLTVGAENRVGNRGKNIYYNGTGALPVANVTELRVTSTPPAPGGVVQFTYDASAKKAGTYNTTANLTSNQTPGVTQDVDTLTVTP